MRGGDGEGRHGLPVTGRLGALAGPSGRAAAFPVREAVERCPGDMEDLRAAEAEAIRLVNEELARSPRYIDLTRAKRWTGVLPTTVLDDGATPLLSLK